MMVIMLQTIILKLARPIYHQLPKLTVNYLV